MSLIYSLPAWAQILFGLLLLSWGVVLWRNWRRAKKDYPDIPYQADPASSPERWSWAEPPAETGLTVERQDSTSWLRLHPLRSSNEVLFSLLGLGLAVLTLSLAILTLLRAGGDAAIPLGATVVILGVMGWLAYALCSVDAPITDIARSEQALILTTRFAVFFHRSARYPAKSSKHLRFSGNLQSFLSMTTDQLDRLPDFHLYAKRRFRFSRRFLLRCTLSQAGWIVGGLNQWVETLSD